MAQRAKAYLVIIGDLTAHHPFHHDTLAIEVYLVLVLDSNPLANQNSEGVERDRVMAYETAVSIRS